MPKFVVLINYGGDDITQLAKLPDRLESGELGAAELGIVIESLHVTFGRYDAVLIIEAPDEPRAAAFILKTMGSSRIRTETMTALDQDQIRAIADGLLD